MVSVQQWLFVRFALLIAVIASIFASSLPVQQEVHAQALDQPTVTTTRIYIPLAATQLNAQQLIYQAYQAGSIDYGTSLLYRAYALFGDTRLPPALYGWGSQGEDSAWFIEAQNAQLSHAQRAQLRPFLVRPDHPESVYSTAANVGIRSQQAQSAALPCDASNWAAKISQTIPVKVHAICGNFDYEGAINQTLAQMESLWGPMAQLMGEPILDDGGFDGGYSNDIDVYLMEPAISIDRGGYGYQIQDFAMAEAVNTPPFEGGTSSGFIMVSRKDSSTSGFKSILAHEFFHVLQDAHNNVISFKGSQEWWFTEASAVWAESHFVRETSGEEVHTRFRTFARNTGSSLHHSVDIYAAYIWPFFMEQEQGAEAIANVWKAVEGIRDDWDRGMAAIDDQLAFDTAFRRFALRNLNLTLTPGDPIQLRYDALDPQFPDDVSPLNMGIGFPLLADSEFTIETELPALSAYYDSVFLSSDVDKISFDLAEIDLEQLDVDLLLKKRNGGWIHKVGVGQRMEVCDAEEVYVAISNHTLELGPLVPAKLTMRSEAGQCDETATGSVQYNETGKTHDGGDELQTTLNINVAMRYDSEEQGYVDDGSTYSIGGKRRVVIRGSDGKVVQESDITYTGSGNFANNNHIIVDPSSEEELIFDATISVDITSVTTVYVDGTSHTFTETTKDEAWSYGCGDANGGVIGKRGTTGKHFTINCTSTLNNDKQNYTLQVNGTIDL